ncbi:hypothetical protein HaLaN_14590 [Haematococcus lacustris]|uniref:Uncharacterized protein n=1 Tax=Haematococcus lacustris TaxID=44745 RepID=A0A699Z6X0_HAELA|nr:hypothetical protein HaLaN_14590 [Haematococcus lacustris]
MQQQYLVRGALGAAALLTIAVTFVVMKRPNPGLHGTFVVQRLPEGVAAGSTAGRPLPSQGREEMRGWHQRWAESGGCNHISPPKLPGWPAVMAAATAGPSPLPS